MPDKEFNSRKYPAQTTRHLVVGAIILILLVGLAFVWFRLGQGAVLFTIGTFAVIGLAVGLVWLVLTFIGWIAGSGE